MANKTIIWSKPAIKQMEAAITYIASDSVQNAEKFLADIIIQINKTAISPQFFPPDKYKKNNDNTYRAFEKHRYRISYRFTSNAVRILRVRHTSKEPKNY
jgi:plasmid stabilization system protein ParE